MPWTKRFPTRLRRLDPQSSPDEVDEELMFHLRSLVEDNLAAGLPPDEAWRVAQGRFGSLRRYADACRPASLLLWPGSALVALSAVALLAGWTAFEVRSLRREQRDLAEARPAGPSAPEAATATPQPAGRTDVAGRVLDRAGRPVGGADVAVILKTWPDGRFWQQAFAATSDDAGRFRLPGLVPEAGKAAVQVAVVKHGHALASAYRLREDGARFEVGDLTFRLDDAPPLTLVVKDGSGRPVADAWVVPASRRSRDGESHVVYFQASEPLRAASDAEGRVGLGCFERGDLAEIYVRPPGGDWELHALAVPDDGDVLGVSTAGRADGVSNGEISPAS